MRYYLIFILLLSMPTALAATISGTVYDISLNTIEKANVEINSVPIQRDITNNGQYTFNVIPGQYEIRAGQINQGELISFAQEYINIDKDGNFVLDLILFPDLSEEHILAEEEIELSTITLDDNPNYTGLLIILTIFLIAIIVGYHYLTKKDTTINNLNVEILQYITNNNGKTTQKEIRQHFPSSEAKISLIISELESEGKIKKIKQGRGNIIIKI